MRKADKYDWVDGATLDDHTKKKHEILQKYFRDYLVTRCQMPREKFRLAIVDGFSGAGVYKGGHFGSPIIFIDQLKKAIDEINLTRAVQGFRPICVESLIIFNDFDRSAIEELKKIVPGHLVDCADPKKKLKIQVEYYSDEFEKIYPQIKARLDQEAFTNVFFNLDQCGYSLVTTPVIKEIMAHWRSAEIILTFMIRSVVTFLSEDQNAKGVPLETDLRAKIDLIHSEELFSRQEWLAKAERVVYDYFKACARYVSPFSINNPEGWRYWLMHFANVPKAREVYNNVLHQDGQAQAHFGRAGLRMLSYNSPSEGSLYLFNENSREVAKGELYDDIPRLISQSGNAMPVKDFYEAAYSETPADSDDINAMILSNPDIEIVSDTGGKRRTLIKLTDTLHLKRQKSFFNTFFKQNKN